MVRKHGGACASTESSFAHLWLARILAASKDQTLWGDIQIDWHDLRSSLPRTLTLTYWAIRRWHVPRWPGVPMDRDDHVSVAGFHVCAGDREV